MNATSLATASLLTDAALSAPDAEVATANGEPSAPFSLGMESDKGSHASHDKSARQPQDIDSQQMALLLALLLNQQPQPRADAAGEAMPLHSLVSAISAGGIRSAEGAGSNRLLPQGMAEDDASLPPRIQMLFTGTQAQPLNLSAEQHAALTRFAAEDLHSIGNENPPVVRTEHKERRAIHPVKALEVEHQSESHSLNQVSPLVMANGKVSEQRISVSSSGAATVIDPHMEELGDKLNQMLKDRIQFQVDNHQQTSTIRLDPPSLGKLEIAIHLDNHNHLVVHIGASQADVMRTLQQFSDNLRQYLTQQNFMQVDVQVSSDDRSQQQQQQQQQQPQQEQILTAQSIDDTPLFQQESVLTKV